VFRHEAKQEQRVTILTTFNQTPFGALVTAATLLLSASGRDGTDGPGAASAQSGQHPYACLQNITPALPI
jgi:hypothetical protein